MSSSSAAQNEISRWHSLNVLNEKPIQENSSNNIYLKNNFKRGKNQRKMEAKNKLYSAADSQLMENLNVDKENYGGRELINNPNESEEDAIKSDIKSYAGSLFDNDGQQNTAAMVKERLHDGENDSLSTIDAISNCDCCNCKACDQCECCQIYEQCNCNNEKGM